MPSSWDDLDLQWRFPWEYRHRQTHYWWGLRWTLQVRFPSKTSPVIFIFLHRASNTFLDFDLFLEDSAWGQAIGLRMGAEVYVCKRNWLFFGLLEGANLNGFCLLRHIFDGLCLDGYLLSADWVLLAKPSACFVHPGLAWSYTWVFTFRVFAWGRTVCRSEGIPRRWWLSISYLTGTFTFWNFLSVGLLFS